MAADPVELAGVAPRICEAPEDTSGSPVNVDASVINSTPDEAFAINGAAPLAVLKAETRPARLEVPVLSVTAYGTGPRLTVKVIGVTSKSKRDGALEPLRVDAAPVEGGTAGVYGV